MHVRWLQVLALAALGFVTAAAAPPAGRADEVAAEAEGEVAVPVTEEPAAGPTDAAPGATPEPWWRPTIRGDWRFNVAVYGWLPNIPVEIDLGRVEVDLPEDLGTLLDSLQFAAMLDFEVRKGKFGAYVAPIVMVLQDTERVLDPITGREHKITIHEAALLLDFGLTYEVGRWHLWNRSDWILPSPAVAVEPFVGARTLVDDLQIQIEPPGSKVEPEITFIAPVVGLRTFWDLTDRLNLRIEGDYGGFDVDHLKQTYNAMGVVGWRFKPRQNLHINVFAGYRYLHVDYEKIATIKATVKGPLLGLTLEFAANGSGFVSPGR